MVNINQTSSVDKTKCVLIITIMSIYRLDISMYFNDQKQNDFDVDREF